MEYSLVKKAINNAIAQIIESDSWNREPIVIVDYKEGLAQKFEDNVDALTYLERYSNVGDWSGQELPWNGDVDEEIILIKYCDGLVMSNSPREFSEYKFYKKINGVEIYRMQVSPTFKATANITVSI